jgi:hypothetical protein
MKPPMNADKNNTEPPRHGERQEEQEQQWNAGIEIIRCSSEEDCVATISQSQRMCHLENYILNFLAALASWRLNLYSCTLISGKFVPRLRRP